MNDPQSPVPTVTFDHHSEEFRRSELEQWHGARNVCPVAFNENYGGFWVVTGYDEAVEVAKDADTFSSCASVPGTRVTDGDIDYLGICGVPRGDIPVAGLGEADIAPHNMIRRALLPYFSRGAVEKLRPTMESLCTWFMDESIARGEMDLVRDFTNPAPAVLTMIMMGLPRENWTFHAEINHALLAYSADSQEFASAATKLPGMFSDIDEAITSQLHGPAVDVSSTLASLEAEGTIDHSIAVSVLWNLISGGIDTTTSLTNWAIVHLAEQPDVRNLLMTSPEMLPRATEEFLRYYSVNKTITRTVTRDVTLAGQQLHRGDRLLLSWLAANHDPAKYEDPDRLDFNRNDTTHLAFGMGIHHCIGSELARMMFQVMLAEILRRIPDYEIQSGMVDTYASPSIAGIISLPTRFSPGIRVGGDRPF